MKKKSADVEDFSGRKLRHGRRRMSRKSSKPNHVKTYSTQRRYFMIKTDPTMLVYDATPGPWQSVIGATNG